MGKKEFGFGMKRENEILEETLAAAERGYAEAYRFLSEEYAQNPKEFGPQTFYFLACLAGGIGLREEALRWLQKAIRDYGWWYRPEVLEDDDLACLNDNPEFERLKLLSAQRYREAEAKTKVVFSWKGKQADGLFLAVHGNTQNGQTAREDWQPILGGKTQWQLETIQSAQPDGYGTYRWDYNESSYLPVAKALEQMQGQGYREIVCGGFSAGCDMLLRALTRKPVRCDLLLLQSPWIPFLESEGKAAVQALRQKNVKLKIFCGACDEDCLPMAKQLYEAAREAGIAAELVIQEGLRHQFAEKTVVEELLSTKTAEGEQK